LIKQAAQYRPEELVNMAAFISLVKIFIILCTTAHCAPVPEVIDLGYGLDENALFWPGTRRFNFTEQIRRRNQNGVPW
jgi:hypothetical protein